MELLNAGIRPYSRRHNFLSLKHIEATLESRFLRILALILFHANSAHTSEEYLEYCLHIVNKHFLEVLFKFIKLRILLILPHLVNNAFINVPIAHV